MPLFKFVPVAWLSERWDEDVGEWLRTMPEEKRQAFGYDFKDLEDAELGPGLHMCMVVVGPGAHKSWDQVRHEMIVTSREDFEELRAPTAAKAKRGKRWLVHELEDDETPANADASPLMAKRLVYDLDEVNDDDDKADGCGGRAFGGKHGKAQEPPLWCDFYVCTDSPSPPRQSRRLEHGSEFYDELYPLSKFVGCVEPIYVEEAWEDHQAFAQ